MKPILYKANEADFTTLGLGVLADELQTLVTEERNGQFYLEMDYPIDGIRFKELKNDRIIKAHASNNLKNQRFKIIRITKPAKGVVKVYAEHVSNHTSDLQIKPNASYSGTASQALNVWESNIVDSHPFSVYSDITTTGSGRWSLEDVRNARQALGGIRGSILDTYGGEYLFDNYRISLLKQRGDDNGLPIMYGKNLIDLEQEDEIASTYTSIFPYSVYMPEREEGQEGEIEPVEVTLPEYFIDSEHVDKYSRRKILKVDFSSDKIKSVEALRSRAQRYITENDIGVPKVNLRVKFVDLAKTLDYKDTAIIEEVNLCDWVVVYFEEIGIQQRAKVIKTVWNVGLDRYEEIEIGETRSSLTQSIHNVVDNRVDEVEKEVNEVRNSANGKNRNHYGPNEPPAEISQVGDTWFRPIGDGETEIYRYNGHMWELVLDTSDTTKNAREIEAVIEQAEADKQALETEINQTYEDAVAEADRLAAIRDNGITITAGQIRAGTIDAARLDAVSIVTSGLSANVIKANHIQADNALFDKLFATSLATDRLSAQQAWIKNINIADASIDGAKITDATIGSAKIASLDVDKISGNTTNFIQSNWNSGVGGGVSISGTTGIRTRASSREESRLENGGISFYDRTGWYRGKVDSSYNNDGVGGISIFIQNGSHFSIVRESSGTYAPILWLEGYSNIMQMNTNVGFKGNKIVDVQSMRFSGGNAAVRRQGSNNVEITTHGEDSTAVLFGQTTAQFYRSIDMNGNNITNQSDIRLKTNVEDSNLNALGEIERLRFIEYDWDKEKPINKGKPTERQFGLIAQYTPFLQTKAGESESYLSVDLTKQINLNSKATQELLHYTRILEKRIEVLESERTST